MEFLQEIKEIECKGEDELLSASLFSLFHSLELANAYFCLISIISSVFNHEFKTRLRYFQLSFEEKDMYLKASEASLVVTTVTVIFFSIIILKFSNNNNT